jgi:hypothetical protein
MGEREISVEHGKGKSRVKLEKKLRFLTACQIAMIDEMLESVTPYGEVILRVQKGRLRCIAKSKSYDAIKMQRPDSGRSSSG